MELSLLSGGQDEDTELSKVFEQESKELQVNMQQTSTIISNEEASTESDSDEGSEEQEHHSNTSAVKNKLKHLKH